MRLIKKLKPSPSQFKNGHIGYKAMLGMKGKLSPCWKGGLSYEPYTTDWTITLKRSIRQRDHYICQVCLGDGWYVHHIDYNKKNCNPDNLITVCPGCHSKTNYNRNYWIKYFNAKRSN